MQTVSTQTEPDTVSQNNKPKRPEIVLSITQARGLVVLAIVAFIVIVGLVARYLVNEHSASIKFFTEALFSFAALLVIISQAVIYWQQAMFMKQQVRSSEQLIEL